MPIELTIPTVGESITEVQINEWLKSEGDSVKQDEPLAVIDSQKTTFELPAPQNGRLVKILSQAGDTVAVGAVIAQFEPDGEAKKVESNGKPAEGKAPEPAKAKAATPPPENKKTAVPEKAEASPKDSGKETSPALAKEAKKPEAKPSAEPVKTKSLSAREEEVVPM
ncbi:MAG TPA: biotin/lipoyl-containing protein, partial [Verrucomicrobiae bacterium]|nr:biotin/lipoyl-containing protein [Verrucomicrobiae bacterium]